MKTTDQDELIQLRSWVDQHILESAHVDCITAVMLKILDGKCKMKPAEKVVMTSLYDASRHLTGELLGDDIHQLISQARAEADEALKLHIYEKRVLAETCISRPVMKGFKAMIRQQGLFTLLGQDENSKEENG